MTREDIFTAFAGEELLVTGPVEPLLRGIMEYLAQGGTQPLLIFADRTGIQVDFDLRGTIDEVLARLPTHPLFREAAETTARRPGPGRPRLGVVSREVSLLPRHWEWLEEQPQGASATLRRLIELARRQEPQQGQLRQARDAASRFMTAMAGNRPGYEEAVRALYAGDLPRLSALISPWPAGIREFVARRLGEDGPVGES